MTRGSVETVISALNRAGVRYVVVGGLAVVAHGFVRFTADLDLVLDPDEGALKRAIATLSGLGYRPRAPVAFEDFADPACRRSWMETKDLTVFSVASPLHPATEVDLFMEPPFDFDTAYARAESMNVAAGVRAMFVSRGDLIDMKRRAGRPQDLADIAGLEAAGGAGSGDDADG